MHVFVRGVFVILSRAIFSKSRLICFFFLSFFLIRHSSCTRSQGTNIDLLLAYMSMLRPRYFDPEAGMHRQEQVGAGNEFDIDEVFQVRAHARARVKWKRVMLCARFSK